MPLRAHGASPEGGSAAVLGERISPLDRREPRGKNGSVRPPGNHRPRYRGSVVVKPAPASSFVMAQAELLFQLLVITFDDPALLGQAHQYLVGSASARGHSISSHSSAWGWLRS